jgi:hypothetical protein
MKNQIDLDPVAIQSQQVAQTTYEKKKKKKKKSWFIYYFNDYDAEV